MALGEWGSVSVTGQVRGADGRFRSAGEGVRKVDRWRARGKVRDLDGVVRDVERYGTTRAGARRELESALRERVTPAAADAAIGGDTLVKDAAEVWRAEIDADGRLSANTRKVYLNALALHIIGRDTPSPLANLAIREVKVSTVERFLRRVSSESGPSAAKMCRSVLRALLDLAVKHDAIAHNPVRSLGKVVAPARDRRESVRDGQRAFTREERDAVLALADSQPRAVSRDLGDLLAFLAGTGARIGEACAVRWSALNLAEGTAQLGPTVVAPKGKGPVIQEVGKTKAAARVVRLSEWLTARLLDRQVGAYPNEWDVVFPSPLAKLRDPSNTSKHVRALLDDAGMQWATSHTFRKTVATWLDAAGASGRETANQLGHARPSMTQDVYMSRRTITEHAATAL
ncbi:tyrosine-type recombinase/integrase [Kineococcus esterisolvens]